MKQSDGRLHEYLHHSWVATASRVTHPCSIEVEVCVIKTSLKIGLLPYFHTFHWLIQSKPHCSGRAL